MKSVQVLAQIKLNLASVEHFSAIACGLADDNPSIKEPVYLATKEVRLASLLIEHLRSLFSHQQSIEAQKNAALSQQQASNSNYQHQNRYQENAQLFTYSNQLTLIRASKSLVANVAKILYLTDSILLQSNELLQDNDKSDLQVSGRRCI